MSGVRALIASVGASVSLIAGALLSLAIGLFLATGGFDEPPVSASQGAVQVAEAAPSTRGGQSGEAAVRVAETPAPARPRPARTTIARPASTRVRPGVSGSSRPSPASGVDALGPVAQAPAAAPSAAPPPATGDGVREVGDAVSSTVSATGDAVAGATSLLGPPVSQAVQDVLDLALAVLQGVTDGVAGGLDSALPR